MEHHYNPYDYQEKAVYSIFNHYYSGNRGNPLIVAPGGSGKTVIVAEFCRLVMEKWKGQKILVISDDQEILIQDYEAIKIQNPDSDIGLYSSGLGSTTIGDITIAGIQSIYKKLHLFKDFTYIIVDEAHKIPFDKKSMYLICLLGLNLPTLGLTATPFRLGVGYIHLADNRFFSDIVYTITYGELLKSGRVCKMINKQPGITLDASQIKKQAGDFILKELSLAFDREGITTEIVDDLKKYKELRKKWLVFAIDIVHCEHISERLNEIGIKSTVVHSKTGINRSIVIDEYKDDKYQAIVSVAMMTTGVNIPEVDLVVLLRSTASPALHGQIIPRGSRVYPGKADCLVLDYAGNLKRNGPIDAPNVKVVGKGGGNPIMKVCENCDEIVASAVRICPECGSEFIFKNKLTLTTSNSSVLSIKNWHNVDSVAYDVHIGKKNIPMLLVRYICGLRQFKEYIAIEHGGYATHKARFWWRRRTDIEAPETSKEAIKKSKELAVPVKILVDESGKYDSIIEQKFTEEMI